MDTRRVLVVDAFTDEPLAGNAAGVVPDAAGLSAGQMQAVARELSVSETAFVEPSGSADRRLRYFTPEREVDLCGHATVGAHAALRAEGTLDAGEHTIETEVGVLDVEVTDDGTVWMHQNAPTVREVGLAYDRVADALGVDPEPLAELTDELPLAVASTGLPFLVVPATYLEVVGGADPDDEAVAELCREVDAEGLYLFTFDALAGDSTLHGRAFVPLAGIPEDPVTGTASGAVGGYLRRHGAFDGMPEELRLEQGHYVDRPGLVRVRAREEVRVGGAAAVALEGTIRVPGEDDDDILEA
jgi:trans-2,3-dihydro-3-hydroxyanthranilate isomerase